MQREKQKMTTIHMYEQERERKEKGKKRREARGGEICRAVGMEEGEYQLIHTSACSCMTGLNFWLASFRIIFFHSGSVYLFGVVPDRSGRPLSTPATMVTTDQQSLHPTDQLSVFGEWTRQVWPAATTRRHCQQYANGTPDRGRQRWSEWLERKKKDSQH